MEDKSASSGSSFVRKYSRSTWVDLIGCLHSHVKQQLLKASDRALLLSIGSRVFYVLAPKGRCT